MTKSEQIMAKVAKIKTPVVDQIYRHYQEGSSKPDFKSYLQEGKDVNTAKAKQRGKRNILLGAGMGGLLGTALGVGLHNQGGSGFASPVVGMAAGAGLGALAGRKLRRATEEHINSPRFAASEKLHYDRLNEGLAKLYKSKKA